MLGASRVLRRNYAHSFAVSPKSSGKNSLQTLRQRAFRRANRLEWRAQYHKRAAAFKKFPSDGPRRSKDVLMQRCRVHFFPAQRSLTNNAADLFRVLNIERQNVVVGANGGATC